MKVTISEELYNEICRALTELEDPDSCNCTYEDAEADASRALVKVQIEYALGEQED